MAARARPDGDQSELSVPRDLAYRLLTRSGRLAESRRVSPLWHTAWRALGRRNGVVRTTLFGFPVRLTSAAVYPLYPRRWPTYNDPLVELVWATAASAGRAVNVVDVGAAMGDTALLLRASCRGQVARTICIEGDPVFYTFLAHNVAALDDVLPVCAALSDEPQMPSLERNPVGTAVATGTRQVPATTLDRVLEGLGDSPVDVLKIDTDGYDGRVLGGASETLARDQPTVIFEWDPGSYVKTRSDWHQPFEVLDRAGYSTFVWYTKYGEFSHFMTGYRRADVDAHAQYCQETRARPEWHYDVIGVPAKRGISPVVLADLQQARAHKAAP